MLHALNLRIATIILSQPDQHSVLLLSGAAAFRAVPDPRVEEWRPPDEQAEAGELAKQRGRNALVHTDPIGASLYASLCSDDHPHQDQRMRGPLEVARCSIPELANRRQV